jgi:phosphopantothenoylcysteine decarboxylase/phosphopantothenate--cysteine ligase
LISISTSDEMFDAVHQHAGDRDIVVMCAAVADYKPVTVLPNKIKKGHEIFSLKLLPTRDILASLAKPHRQFLLIGFAAETQNVEENAEKKLRDKNCDVVVANDVSDTQSGMESDENEVTIVFRSGEMKKIRRAQKKIIARELVKIFSDMREKCLTKKV